MRTIMNDTTTVNTLINNTINTHSNTITNNPIIDDINLDNQLINPEQIHQDEQEPIFL